MANDHIQEVGVRFTTEGAAEYQRTIKEINQEQSLASTEYQKTMAAMDKNATATEKLTAKSKLYQSQVGTQKDKVATLKDELDKLTGAEEKDEAAIAKKKQELAKAETQLAKYEGKLKDTTEELKKHSEWTDKVSGKLKDAGDKMTSVGKAILPASIASTAALTGMAKSAIDFESAFAGVRKTVDASPEEFDALSDSIKEMAERIPATTTALAGIMELGGQLGVPTENLQGFTEVIAAIGVSSNLTEEAAATMFAQFANITKMDYGNFDKLGSVLIDLGNNFATTESAIMEMSMRLAGAGTQIGLSEPEILSLSTVLSSVGISAEAGGTAFSKLMITMQAASQTGMAANDVITSTGMTLRELELLADADGKAFKAMAQDMGMTSAELKNMMKASRSLEDFSNVAGVTAQEFSQLYGKDAPGAILMFLQGLASMDEEGQSAILTLNEMGLNEVRLRDTTLRSVSAIDLYNDALSTGNEAWQENIALQNEADQRYGTTESQIEMLKNQFNNFAIELGEILLPIIQGVVEALSGFIGWLQSLDSGTQTAIVAVLAVIAALGPLLITLGKVTTGLGSLIGFLPQVGSALGGLGGVFKGLWGIISANPIMAIVALITAVLIPAIMHLWNNSEAFRNFITTMWEAIKSVFSAFIDFMKGVFVTSWTGVIETVKGVFSSLWESMKAIWENIKGIFTGIIDFVKNVFTGNWKGAWDAVVKVFGNVFGALGNLVKAPINAVISAINGAIKGINNIAIDIPDWVPLVGGKHFGFSIPTLPMLAAGGTLLQGMAIVAEAGPELIRQEGGKTVVTPLSGASKNSALDNLSLSGETIALLARAIADALRGSSGDGHPVIIRFIVDGRTIAEAAFDDLLALLGKKQVDLLTARG